MPETTARLSQEELEQLERRLDIALSRAEPSITRTTQHREPTVTSDLRRVADEVLSSARKGVRIADHLESRPVMPLLAAAEQPVPPVIRVDYEEMGYEFYFAALTTSILLPEDQYPTHVTVDLALQDDVVDNTRKCRPIRLFPSRRDIRYFGADFEGAIGIDAGLELTVPELEGRLLSLRNAQADARVRAQLIFGPMSFEFRRTEIEVTGESDRFIHWTYRLRSALTGTSSFGSLLILKVASEARSVSVHAEVSVTPSKRTWIPFKEYLPTLHAPARTLALELRPRTSPT